MKPGNLATVREETSVSPLTAVRDDVLLKQGGRGWSVGRS